VIASDGRYAKAAVKAECPLVVPSNKRLQLPDASGQRSVRYCAVKKSPQLMRVPLSSS
jgi:hypothetical protein